MARKNNQSWVEDLIEMISLFPWWVGLILATVLYIWLHSIAEAPLVIINQPGQINTSVIPGIQKGLVLVGQYALPLICIFGALLSFIGRKKREKLFVDAGVGGSVSAINGMSWQEFEMLVGEAFRRGGYSVEESGGGGADGGVDLVLRKDGEKFLVQCKQWKAYKVGVQVVRELYGVMAAEGAAGGFVVTSGTFTQEAKDFASGRNIDLIDGTELKQIITQVQHGRGMQSDESVYSLLKQAIPNCPSCGGSMVKRIAKQGANAGKMFWGCSKYPKCRGTVAVD